VARIDRVALRHLRQALASDPGATITLGLTVVFQNLAELLLLQLHLLFLGWIQWHLD
jgi:hypothetical protein